MGGKNIVGGTRTGEAGKSGVSWAPCAAMAAMLSAASVPAWAGATVVLPEPASLSLLGAGVVGVIALYQTRRRK